MDSKWFQFFFLIWNHLWPWVVLNRNRAFFFNDVVSLTCLEIYDCFTTILAWKLETIGGFMKLENQINWRFRLLDHRWCSWNTFLSAAAQRRWPRGAKRPLAGAEARRRPKKRFMNTTYGPGAGFVRFYFLVSGIRPKIFKFFMSK